MLKALLRPVYRPILQAYREMQHSRSFLLRQMPKGSACAEIGVFKGEFSQQILDQTQPRKLHLIDPWKFQASPEFATSWYGGDKGHDQHYMDLIYEEVRARFQKQILSEVVEIHRKPSVESAADFPANYFDWIYVDGDHRYNAVMEDMLAYRSKVKPGGYVAGDDYESPGWWEGGVKKAVDELISLNVYETVLIKKNQFILRKPLSS